MNAEEHRRQYKLYDQRVDIVSVVEAWYTLASLAPTVSHFERFPRLHHPDGNPANPDFSILFEDGTGIVGELAHIPPNTSALSKLGSQIGRYDTLTELPSGPVDANGGHPTAAVTAVDVIVFAPMAGVNAACDDLAKLLDDPDHPYQPQHPPMVLSYSQHADEGSYTFQRPVRGRNEMVRDHGRDPSLGLWLAKNHDELRGIPKHFQSIKATARFMNDDPPDLYIATQLWNFILPDIAASRGIELPANIDITPAELETRLRDGYGYAGRTKLVRKALEFLKTARLSERTADGWVIYFRDLGRIEHEISDALLHEFFNVSKKTKPIAPAKKTPAQPGATAPAGEDGAEPDVLFDGTTSVE